MDFADLKQELADRGFDGILTDTRIGAYINMAITEICERTAWPFLVTATTGVAPLTITDVRQVLSVVDTVNDTRLVYQPRRELLDTDANLATIAQPSFWWLEQGVVRVWPLNTTNSLSVQYIQAPADLVSDSDTPVIPARWHLLIVDGAAIRAYLDSDNFQAATTLQQFHDARVEQMVQTLMVPNLDGPRFMITSQQDY